MLKTYNINIIIIFVIAFACVTEDSPLSVSRGGCWDIDASCTATERNDFLRTIFYYSIFNYNYSE